MAKLESSEQILTFYQQLQAQGAAYGLMCIELQSITPDIDLCHPGSTSVARRKMMIAIYQKLQDVECVSETYVEARNFVRQYSSSCDGFQVLYQLVRLVHPNLGGDKMYDIPKLTQANDLFHYADKCRNFIM